MAHLIERFSETAATELQQTEKTCNLACSTGSLTNSATVAYDIVKTASMIYRKSRTFKDLLCQIPKLSRTYILFKDFPGLGKLEKNFQGLSRSCGHPVV